MGVFKTLFKLKKANFIDRQGNIVTAVHYFSCQLPLLAEPNNIYNKYIHKTNQL